MVKKCEVLYYNQFSNILAFKFDDVNIQINIDKKLDKNISNINIKYENGCYSPTDEDETKEIKSKVKKVFEETVIDNDINFETVL